MNKSALCIGINDYPGTDMDLQGCINDAHDWGSLLSARGFSVQKLLNEQATKAAMVDGFRKLITTATSGDLLVISFSGHGTYELDLEGDDVTGLDQALCPHDIKTAGHALVDDEIHDLFKLRRDGVRIVLIADSCHSGSVNRALAPRAAELPRPKFLPLDRWMPAARSELADKAKKAAPTTKTKKNLASASTDPLGDLLMSGCNDGETDFSYDAVINDRANGAFTFYALKALKALPAAASYAEWHREIVDTLPTVSYPQHPQLVASPAIVQRPLLT